METFTQVTIILITLILISRLVFLFSQRFSLPAISIQLLIGILLGPSLLNLLGGPIIIGTWGSVSPNPLHSILKILAEIGLIQLMFLAGLQTEWQLLKTNLQSIFSLGSWGFVLPAVVIAIIIRLFVERWTEALAVGSIVSGSGIGVLVYNLKELNFHRSRTSNILLGASMISGGMAVLLMIASQATNYGMTYGTFKMAIAVSWFMGKMIMFFAISYFLTSRFLGRAVKAGFQRRPLQMLIGYILLVAALYGWGSMHFGSFVAVGIPFLGGALIGISNLELRDKIMKGLQSGLAKLPTGIFLVVLGMEVDLKNIEHNINLLALLLVGALGAKLVGGWIATSNKIFESQGERLLLIIGNLSQGEMGMIISAYLFSRDLVNPEQFYLAIFIVVIFTMLTPVLMRITHAENQ